MEQLQISDREPVEPDMALLLNPAETADMGNLLMLGEVEVPEDGSRSDDAQRKVIDTKSFQRFDLKMTG